MNGGSRIVDLHPPRADRGLDDPAGYTVDDPYPGADHAADPVASDGIGSRLASVGAMVLVALWLIGGTVSAAPSLFAAHDAAATIEFVGALCMPPVLLGMLWLLARRSSRAEARRFSATARAMRAEAAALERTVAALSIHIDANREQLADQTTALMAMGDAAAERLSAVRVAMVDEVRAADAQAMRLTEAAAAAQSSLGVLLSSLPRAHAETTQMARTLETTGLSASEHAAALDAQLVALAARGRDADAVASGAAQKLAAHIARMESTSATAAARLEVVTADMSGAVDALLDRTATAVDEARKGIAAQGHAMLAMLETNQAALDLATRDSVEGLADRIAAVDRVIDRIGQRLEAQRRAGDNLFDGLETAITRVDGRLDTLHGDGAERLQTLAASISALGGSTDAMTESLKAGNAMAHAVIATAEDLLTALDAAAREIDETLPDALGRLDDRIGGSRAVVAAAKPELLALVTAAESTHDAIEAIAGLVSGQRATLDQLSHTLLATLDSGHVKADALARTVEDTIARTAGFAQTTAPQLVDALAHVGASANDAADRARAALASVVPEAARTLETASAAAMGRAVGAAAERQIAAIATAADAAVAATERASVRLAAQATAIDRSVAAVDTRLQTAQAEREASDRDSFARRTSLLIEALNSGAIDITRSFSHEVSDSAWAAYLKGDRGVFTRRAVRLLDASETREIAHMYDADERFREQVNRYIHDFESMLRTILAQRDGSPLGVTLLSSDMGKLYVAMAQAIDRLR